MRIHSGKAFIFFLLVLSGALLVPKVSVPSPFCKDLAQEIKKAKKLRDFEPSHAEEILLNVLNLALARGCQYHEARALHALAAVAAVQQRLTEANRRLDQARVVQSILDSSKKIDQLEADITYLQATVMMRFGLLDQASDMFHQVLDLDRRLDIDAKYRATALNQLARVQRLLGDYKYSKSLIQEGLDLIGTTSPGLQAILWQEKFWIELQSGQLTKADQALDQATRALTGHGDMNNEASVMAARAALAIRRKQWALCLQQAENALLLSSQAKMPDHNLALKSRSVTSDRWR